MRRQIRTLIIISFFAFILISGKASAPDEAQKAWLRMSASGSTYVGNDMDPWISESYVIYTSPTGPMSAEITVDNIKNDRSVNDIVIPIVTNNINAISSIVVNGTTIYPGSTWKTGRLFMTANDGYALGELPPHGVYNDPAANWVEYRSSKRLTRDGTPGESILIRLAINFKNQDIKRLKIHLDAYGWTEELEKKACVIIDHTRDAVFAPFSHDVTIVVPEISLPVLMATSIGLCGYLFIKRKTTKSDSASPRSRQLTMH